MSQAYDAGTKVKWKWGEGWGRGEVSEVFTSEVTRTIKGTEVTRKASDDDPAYLIEQADGDRVLKGHSEIERDS